MTQDELYAQRRYHRDQITAIDATLDAMAFEAHGVKIGDRVKYGKYTLELYGVESLLPGQVQFKGWLITKDGVKTSMTRIIYNPREMKKL